MNEAPKRALAYLRVSKSDGSQDEMNQRPDLVRYAKERGLDLDHQSVERYKDRLSGRRSDRPGLKRLLADAESGKLSGAVLLIWSLDRLTRGGIAETFQLIGKLGRYGVKIASVREPWLDAGSPTYELLLSLASYFAREETRKISERVKAGLIAARQRGVVCGRPKLELPVPPEEIYTAYCGMERPSIRDLAKRYHLSRSFTSALILQQKRASGNGHHSPSDQRAETA